MAKIELPWENNDISVFAITEDGPKYVTAFLRSLDHKEGRATFIGMLSAYHTISLLGNGVDVEIVRHWGGIYSEDLIIMRLTNCRLASKTSGPFLCDGTREPLDLTVTLDCDVEVIG
jgi:hypothetical protein